MTVMTALAVYALVLVGCVPTAIPDIFGESGTGASTLPATSPIRVKERPPTLITGESRMFQGTEFVTMLNPLTVVRHVYSYGSNGQRVDYAEGVDWVLQNGQLARTAASRMPDFNDYRYVAGTDGRFDFAVNPRNPPRTINYNVYIDYESTIADKLVVATPIRNSVTTIACLGDSIAAGADTIAFFYGGNDSQSFCGLLRTRLAGEATVVNESVPGAVVDGVWSNLDSFVAKRPNVAIIEFGTNDHLAGAAGLATFAQHLDDVVARYRAVGTSVILLGFFQQNKLWALEDPTQTIAYNAAIRQIAVNRGVKYIDIYRAYDFITPQSAPPTEQYFHFMGDFIHHPNVYDQRIYYSLLIPYFLHVDTPASQIDGYVIGPK